MAGPRGTTGDKQQRTKEQKNKIYDNQISNHDKQTRQHANNTIKLKTKRT